jgi:hypothetical protein
MEMDLERINMADKISRLMARYEISVEEVFAAMEARAIAEAAPPEVVNQPLKSCKRKQPWFTIGRRS